MIFKVNNLNIKNFENPNEFDFSNVEFLMQKTEKFEESNMPRVVYNNLILLPMKKQLKYNYFMQIVNNEVKLYRLKNEY